MLGIPKPFRISWPSFLLGAAACLLLLLMGLALVGYEISRRQAIEVNAALETHRAQMERAKELREKMEAALAEWKKLDAKQNAELKKVNEPIGDTTTPPKKR
jgi:uncharacterized protein HemX